MGDDASCLNLNRALQPRLLGVKTARTRRSGRLSFSARTSDDWKACSSDIGAARDDNRPAIVDANTLQWALQKKLGDALEYTRRARAAVQGADRRDASAARSCRATCSFPKRDFVEKFPGNGGYRYFLIDAPRGEGGRGARRHCRAR